jgi:hypothetical protein
VEDDSDTFFKKRALRSFSDPFNMQTEMTINMLIREKTGLYEAKLIQFEEKFLPV